MKKKAKTIISLSFVIIFLFSFFMIGCKFIAVSNAFASAESLTSANGMCVMESTTGRVLYSKNENKQMPMASTTKIMTAITAIENCKNLDEEFEISPKAVGISGTSIYLRKGETMSMRDLLYGLMLVSGNDTSVAIGEKISGDTKKFVELMNMTAKKIGAYNTHFDNTHGLDSENHYTTAYDLALITSYALHNDTFKEIVSTKNTKIINKDGKTRYLKNKNKLLYLLEGCNGVKTGFTNDAGRCLVSSCERDGMNIVCVVLNCRPMFEESQVLLNKAFEEYKMVDLTSGYNYQQSIPVIEGRQEEISIGTKEHYYYPLRADEEKNIEYEYSIQKSIEAPITKGSEVGQVKIFVNKNLQFSEKIYTMENVRRKSIWDKIKFLVDEW